MDNSGLSLAYITSLFMTLSTKRPIKPNQLLQTIGLMTWDS